MESTESRGEVDRHVNGKGIWKESLFEAQVTLQVFILRFLITY